jgi:hypothetical protein
MERREHRRRVGSRPNSSSSAGTLDVGGRGSPVCQAVEGRCAGACWRSRRCSTGASREDAAKIHGMDRQTLRDWGDTVQRARAGRSAQHSFPRCAAQARRYAQSLSGSDRGGGSNPGGCTVVRWRACDLVMRPTPPLLRVEIRPASSAATAAICYSTNRPVGPSIVGKSAKRTSTPASSSRDRKATGSTEAAAFGVSRAKHAR